MNKEKKTYGDQEPGLLVQKDPVLNQGWTGMGMGGDERLALEEQSLGVDELEEGGLGVD